MKELRERLRSARKKTGKTQAEIARAIGITQSSYADLETGKAKSTSHIAKLSAVLGVRPVWLETGKGSPDLNDIEPGPAVRGMVPLISWVKAGQFSEAVDRLQPGDADGWYPCPKDHSPGTYALRVVGESMAPKFMPGDLIMVDPAVSPDNGRFVIAKKTGSQEVTFKQLIREGGQTYLKATNPQWPEPIIKISEDWTVCGVVICKVELF